MAIITATQFKVYRSITVSTYDALLAVLISGAQSALELYCDRSFDSATYTAEKYDGDGSSRLLLRNYPVTALTTIAVIDDAGNSTTLDSTDYRANLTNGEVFRLAATESGYSFGPWPADYPRVRFDTWPNWPEGFQNVSVTYTAGYTSNYPAALAQMMYEIVNEMFSRVQDGGNDPNLKSERIGDYQWVAADVVQGVDLMVANRATRLQPFRRVTS